MEDEEDGKPFAIERAKSGRAKCKKCKCPIEKDTIRIAKLISNPFSEGSKMKAWHHVSCIFELFAKQRATTKRIEDPEVDISGWDNLQEEDKKIVLEKLQEFEQSYSYKSPKTKTPLKRKRNSSDGQSTTTPNKLENEIDNETKSPMRKKISKKLMGSPEDSKNYSDDSKTVNLVESKMASELKIPTKDDLFREFRRICANVAEVDAYKEKTAILRNMFIHGSSGEGFKSDIVLWCKLLLPQAAKRIYNLQSKQLVKLFSRILLQDENSMLENLEQGDIAETIRLFFESSTAVKASPKSLLTIQEVDKFLEFLSGLTKEDEQMHHFKSIIDKCTGNDLKMIIRLIKHDLRINAGPKHILNAVHEDAFKAFQVSMNLEAVVQRFLPSTSTPSSTSPKETTLLTSPGGTKIALSLMTPVLPMLAEACKSVEMAMKKCCNGMFAEIKYDGERVQVHKKGIEFQYFSRSLKPVMAHKIRHFKDYIPKAFPDGDDLILDSEILLIDNKTSKPLPFGSLGVHKKSEFKDANVCLFVFDCIYYNGEVLINKSMKERRQILKSRMTEIPNRIMLSESQEVHKKKDLAEMIAKVLRLGLEGLVLKDIKSKYEPGKRHWLKVKKDYLFGGAMADSADLVVLGAWYGTGQKGGMMSIFLMGCYDPDADKWLTVTKVHSGHDDAMLEALQNKLDMIKIGKDPAKVPKWLRANKPMVPDFVARDPKKQPVWEITGAEFTNQGVHTADGISIRFPRVTRIRDDKDWSTATNLNELRELFRRSSDCLDFSILLGTNNSDKKDPKLIASTSSTPSTSGKIDKGKNISPKGVKVEKTNVDDDDKEKTKGKIKIEGRIRVKKEFHIDQPSTSRQIMKEIETCGEENVKTKKISNLLEASYDPDIKIKEEATPIENLEHEESIIKDETDSKKDDTSAKYYSFVNNDVCIIIFLLIVIYSRIGYNTFINSMFYINILYHIFIDSRSIRYFHNAFSRRRLFLRFSL
uniref:DNA ligase 3 isoform X1 n=2 Tax=Vespula vulgaris TaxID=7454 RepID=UPI00223C45B5|nr:DNA ligase 3 isoform X1 [Vespula vulgaris]XP_050852905.1 DNA ligase 3 isoform X1 [Vespula vulgaris]XP_050852907.1 DNA ligase 3 isoform X1 [Vespula vulgaris]XP_050852908.1 DNA ligase 3 isoform X1 [Vespula vulgaris]